MPTAASCDSEHVFVLLSLLTKFQDGELKAECVLVDLEPADAVDLDVAVVPQLAPPAHLIHLYCPRVQQHSLILLIRNAAPSALLP